MHLCFISKHLILSIEFYLFENKTVLCNNLNFIVSVVFHISSCRGCDYQDLVNPIEDHPVDFFDLNNQKMIGQTLLTPNSEYCGNLFASQLLLVLVLILSSPKILFCSVTLTIIAFQFSGATFVGTSIWSYERYRSHQVELRRMQQLPYWNKVKIN